MRSKVNVNNESVPTHALLSPSDNKNILNFINFNNLGSSNLKSSSAFKKIQSASKSNPQDLFNSATDFSIKYSKLHDLYLNDLSTQDSLYYGNKRQHNYASVNTMTNGFNTLLDNTSVSKLLDYNFNQTLNKGNYSSTSNSEITTIDAPSSSNSNIVKVVNTVNSVNDSGFRTTLNVSKEFNQINHKQQSNLNQLNTDHTSDCVLSPQVIVSDLISNSSLNSPSFFYKNLSIKSPNQQILPGDRNIRNISTLNPNKVNINFDDSTRNTSLFEEGSKLRNTTNTNLLNSVNTRFTPAHIPTNFTSNKSVDASFDKFTSNGANSQLMAAKEELAPNFIFTPFWVSLWSHSNPNLRVSHSLNFINKNSNLSIPSISEYAEYDFRN